MQSKYNFYKKQVKGAALSFFAPPLREGLGWVKRNALIANRHYLQDFVLFFEIKGLLYPENSEIIR